MQPDSGEGDFDALGITRDQLRGCSLLGSSLDDRNKSYKFYWLLALLELITRDQTKRRWKVVDVTTEMVVLAMGARAYFQLNFPDDDKLAEVVDQIAKKVKFSPSCHVDRGAIGRELFDLPQGGLARYVPFRFVRPWVPEARGILDSKVNSVVADGTRSSEYSGPYRFNGSHDEIEVPSSWARFLRQNATVIRGWAERRLISFLSDFNPPISNVPCKLFVDPQRNDLTRERAFWRRVMSSVDIRDIYNQKSVDPNDFELDHFAPWRLVAHDEMWNLIPCDPRTNSSKSDGFPELGQYLERLVDVHHTAITESVDDDSRERQVFIQQIKYHVFRSSEHSTCELGRHGIWRKEDLIVAYQRHFEELRFRALDLGFNEWNWISDG